MCCSVARSLQSRRYALVADSAGRTYANTSALAIDALQLCVPLSEAAAPHAMHAMSHESFTKHFHRALQRPQAESGDVQSKIVTASNSFAHIILTVPVHARTACLGTAVYPVLPTSEDQAS